VGVELGHWSTTGWQELFSVQVLSVFIRSAVMATIVGLVCLSVGTPLAIVSYFSGKRNAAILVSIACVPLLLNSLLISYGWNTLFYELKDIIPDVMRGDGAVVAGMSSMYLPYYVLTYYSALSSIDRGQVLAARTLGDNVWMCARRVLIPLSYSGMLVGYAIVVLPAFAEFVIPYLMGDNKQYVTGTYVYYLLNTGKNWPLATAIIFTVSLLMAGFVWLVSARMRTFHDL